MISLIVAALIIFSSSDIHLLINLTQCKFFYSKWNHLTSHYKTTIVSTSHSTQLLYVACTMKKNAKPSIAAENNSSCRRVSLPLCPFTDHLNCESDNNWKVRQEKPPSYLLNVLWVAHCVCFCIRVLSSPQCWRDRIVACLILACMWCVLKGTRGTNGNAEVPKSSCRIESSKCMDSHAAS